MAHTSVTRTDRYTLAGIEIKRPTSFKIERYKVTNATRLANADMVADVLARKRTYNLTYDAIQSSELNKILDAVWNNMEYFFPFTYVENGVEKTVTVYPGKIPAELHRPSGNWVWKGVSFQLIEQ